MKLRLCLLLNRLGDFDFAGDVERYLPSERFAVTITDMFPEQPDKYDLIVPWSYRRHLPQAEQAGNVVVFHSSDLPQGKGWAPLYHLFANNASQYTLCGIRAANEIDSGDIVIRARFDLAPDYTAPFLRQLDQELMLLLAGRLAERFRGRALYGKPQTGEASYKRKRSPADSQVDLSQPLSALLPHLRGLEPDFPAFFYHEGRKYLLEIRPANAPRRPAHIRIEYFDTGESEVWDGWDADRNLSAANNPMGS